MGGQPLRDLDACLLAAHARNDRWALVELYTVAANAANNIDRACFYLTHAYIFGLEMNHPSVPALYARLARHGRV